MGTALRRVELPIPARGMNVDTSPSQIGPEYCRYARNVILSEPGQVRTRTGWRRVVGYPTIYTNPSNATNCAVLGVAPYPSQDGSSMSMILNAAEAPSSYASEYHLGYDELTGSATVKLRVVTVPASGSASQAAATGSVLTRCEVIGNTVIYDNVLYGVAQSTGGTSGKVFTWAGTNAATNTTGGVTITNGSRTGTFSSAPASSMQNMFLRITGGATGPASAQRYRYRILQHTAASATFYLSEPYGLGDSIANVPDAVGATTTIEVASSQVLSQVGTGSIFGAGCVGLFRDRLFIGRFGDAATLGGAYSQATVGWSYPGYPSRIPPANTFQLPTNEQIMGMATVPNGLLIFQPTRTYILTGYDEDSFSLSLLSNEIGCIHSASICYHNNAAYWCAEDGVYTSAGEVPRPVTQTSPGVGIKSSYLGLVAAASGTRSKAQYRHIGMGVVGDHLVLAINNLNNAAPTDAFACDLRTATWTRWGNSTQAQGYYQPWNFVTTSKRQFAVTPWQLVDISNIFDPEDVVDPVYHQYDEDYTSAAATTTSTITAELQYADFRLGQDTVRLRGVHVEHNCHYYNATSSPRVAWALTLDNDAEIDESATAVGDIDARYIGNTGAPEFQKYYITKFEDTDVSRDAAAVRIKLTKTASTNSAKLFRVYLMTDPQATAVSRVDNPTL